MKFRDFNDFDNLIGTIKGLDAKIMVVGEVQMKWQSFSVALAILVLATGLLFLAGHTFVIP